VAPFAKEVRREADGWTVVTGQGQVGLVIKVDAATRTVDFCMHPAPGVEAKAFSRIVSNGDRAEFVVTHPDAITRWLS
jgi:hypothetical protein